MRQPLISIVMPSLNQAQFIEASIESVLAQDYQNLELIIQDGGSQDETVTILEREAAVDQRIRWESVNDEGPADAIHRALSKVRGEIVGWLNSDDLFEPHALSAAHRAFAHNVDWVMCYGHGIHIDDSDQQIGDYPTLQPSVGLEGFKSGCFICQPTVFFKTSLLSMLGGLDLSLKTAFDYDYWMRAFKYLPNRIGFIDLTLARSRLHQNCITQRMRETVALEGLYLSQKHFGVAQSHWLVTHLEEIRLLHKHDQNMFQNHIFSFFEKVATLIGTGPLLELTGAELFEQYYARSKIKGG